MNGPGRRGRGTHVATIALVALLAAACRATEEPPRTAVPIPSPGATIPATTDPGSARPSGPPSGPTVTPAPASPTASAVGFDPEKVQLVLRRVVSGLDAPLGIVNAGDGSGRIFVVQQAGLIRVVKDGTLAAAPFLDVRDRVSCCGERGLLGLAFAPGFGTSTHDFFIDYTDVKGDTVIARGSTDAAGARADPGDLRTLLTIDQPFANHNGGDLVFGPDGYLYIGMGDGGSGGDPHGNGQSLSTLLGKLLRIDVTSAAVGGKPYVVPADNPFVGQSDARPEIWAYGLRNPWRFSFDRVSGTLWIGDVGQDRYEEVDRAGAGAGPGAAGRGADYGWSVMEGRHCYAAQACDRTGFSAPIAEYSHATGDCAVVGGYVYRGSSFPMLNGGYLFGDECSGRIRAVSAAGPETQTAAILLDTSHVISSFGEDEAGELYLTDLASGELYQVTATVR